MIRPNCLLPLVAAWLAPLLTASADDWPQWRGPERDAVWREAGVTATFGDKPLDVVWRAPVDLGYAGPAVAEGKVYVADYTKRSGDVTNNPGGRDRLEGVERVRCFDAATGEEFWRHEYEREYFLSYPSGPRCTPTVDGGLVYALGAEGDLYCLSTADGSVVWSKSFADDYGAPTPQWGHSAHPLVDGDTLYCLVGGEGSVVVAFDKRTGEEKWRALSTPSIDNEVGYCPPRMITHNGQQQLVVFHPEGVTGLVPATGEALWNVPLQSSYGMSIAAPNLLGDRLFTTGYGDVSVFFRLPSGAGEPEVLWQGGSKTSLSAANATPISDGDVIYGCHANSSALVAVDTADGSRLWETTLPTLGEERKRGVRHGTAFVVRHGDTDRYWLAAETGDLILARLTRGGYEELGRKRLVEPTGETWGRAIWWSHPAFAMQSVFARNDEELVRVSLAE